MLFHCGCSAVQVRPHFPLLQTYLLNLEGGGQYRQLQHSIYYTNYNYGEHLHLPFLLMGKYRNSGKKISSVLSLIVCKPSLECTRILQWNWYFRNLTRGKGWLCSLYETWGCFFLFFFSCWKAFEILGSLLTPLFLTFVSAFLWAFSTYW